MPIQSLSNSEREALINAAMTAFGSRAPADLQHGFRLFRKGGDQVAAIYWSNLAAGNRLEVAIAPGRIPETADPQKVQAWLEVMHQVFPAPVNVHQHEKQWPTFGGSYKDVLSFLAECQNLRIGWLKPERERQVQELIASRGVADREQAHLNELYEQLRPTRVQALIDLVKRAGVSVTDWYVKKDGSRVATPRSNMAYKYRWAFGGAGGPAVACLWHANMQILDGYIVHRGNFREAALSRERVIADKTILEQQKKRARLQAPRARALDDLIAGVGINGRIRVIVNEGDMRDAENRGEDSSKVSVRHLDKAHWVVHEYDAVSGAYLLRRERSSHPAPDVATTPEFVDQHDIAGSDAPGKVDRPGATFFRDPDVRRAVLYRASGHCERCKTKGFRTAAGSLYLETHHVVPLSEGGVDREWNVVGICPSHHREAHFGVNREAMREEFKALLRGIYNDGISFTVGADSDALTPEEEFDATGG